MRHRPIVLALAAALALGACGGAGETTYRDPAGRFAMDVPGDLRLTASEDGSQLRVALASTGAPLLSAEVGPMQEEALDWLDSPLFRGNGFFSHVLFRAQAWCAAGPPEEGAYCERVNGFTADTSDAGVVTVRFVPVLVRETETGPADPRPLGRVWAVNLGGTGAPGQALIVYPADRTATGGDYARAVSVLLRSIRPADTPAP